LLEDEVIREFFDIGQEFLDEENFAVILTVDFHTSIEKMKISLPQGRHTHRNHQRSTVEHSTKYSHMSYISKYPNSVTSRWARC